MKKNFIAASVSIALLGTASVQANGIQITPSGTTSTSSGAVQRFTGHAAIDMKVAGDSGKHGSVGIVDFAPGARTAWHTHPIGQLLIVTDGKGWVQEDGQAKQEIKAGDVVWIEAGVKHWHGAAQASGMRHLSVSYIKDGKSSDWMERVSDEQYNAR